MKRIPQIIKNIVGISLPTFIIIAIIVELGLRAFASVSDTFPRAWYDVENDLLVFEPNQRGTVRVPAYTATYRINGQGWNSHLEYTQEPVNGIQRIAIIGDSYIEALQVDYQENLSAVLDDLLGDTAEVYSFGKSGAPLSQYLHMMRQVQEAYHPDVYIITLIHNDFEQSLRENINRPYFMQYREDDNGSFIELEPVAYTPNFWQNSFRFMTNAATVRYLAYNFDLFAQVNTVFNSSVVDTTPDVVDVSLVTNIVRYSFEQYQEVAAIDKARLIFLIDADRTDIYNGDGSILTNERIYNNIVADVALELNIPLLDLTETFSMNYNLHHQRFEHLSDWHWNTYAHQLIAQTIFDLYFSSPQFLD